VFFDTLGVAWSYEPEGTGGHLYLPDFWLPDLQPWLEVKDIRDQREVEAWIEFAEAADPNWEMFAEEPDLKLRSDWPLPDQWRRRALLAYSDIPNPRQPDAGDTRCVLVLRRRLLPVDPLPGLQAARRGVEGHA
jgi:hypothetical protein